MRRIKFKPGTLLNPLPVVMASVRDKKGNDNIITIAWTGIVNSNPPMTYISVKPERHSFEMLKEAGDFCINLVTRDLAKAADYCGVRSGKDVDKWKKMDLTKRSSEYVKSPGIEESPLVLECKIKDIIEYPSHHMFVAEIKSVDAAEEIVDERGKICLEKANLVTYCHGEYFGIAKSPIGRFGFSVMKPKTRKRLNKEQRKKRRKKRR